MNMMSFKSILFTLLVAQLADQSVGTTFTSGGSTVLSDGSMTCTCAGAGAACNFIGSGDCCSLSYYGSSASGCTAMSFRFVNDPSIYTNVILSRIRVFQNHWRIYPPTPEFISIIRAIFFAIKSAFQEPSSSGDWIWDYLVVSVGFGLLLG